MLSNTTGSVRSTNEEERQKNIKNASYMDDDANNPCKKELELSYKCMSDNGYDKKKCSVFFQNYNACKEFWNRVKRDRRANGIVPYLPYPQDRDTVKAEYMKKWNLNLRNKDKMS